MFVKFHERLKDSEKGFTLIELLVVILIIAILAAIAIPVFLNQRKKGWKAQSESFLKDAATAQESYATGNSGSYTSDVAELETEGFNIPAANTEILITALARTDGSYCLKAFHGKFNAGDPAEEMTFDSNDGVPVETPDDCT